MLLVATIIHPPHGGDAESWFGAAVGNPTRFYVAHLLFLVGTLLLLPAVLMLSLRLAHQRPRLALLGAGFSLAGCFGVAGFVGIDLVVWQMARGHADPAEMLALLQAVSTEPGVVLPLYGLTGMLGLGFALLLGGLEHAIARGCVAITLAGVGLWAAGLPVAPLSITGTVLLLIGLARAGPTFDARTQLKIAPIGGCARPMILQKSIEVSRARRSRPLAAAPLRGPASQIRERPVD